MPLPTLLLAAALEIALPHTHLALNFEPGSASVLPPLVIQAAVREAADIWAPYRVAIDQIMPCASQPDESFVLYVVTDALPRSRVTSYARALAAIKFEEDTPDRVVTVYFDQLTRFATTVRLSTVREELWGPAVRQRMLGRALGRALAHEIGHYLLGSRAHSRFGLMRAVHLTDQLFTPSRVNYHLSSSEVQRLAARLNRQEAVRVLTPGVVR
jgi:hypothetical protein